MILFFFALIFCSGTVFAAEIPETEKKFFPVQIPIDDENYKLYREKAGLAITNYKNQCAKLVNRIFLARFGILMFGNAWDLALRPENQKYLKLIWQLDESDFRRNFHLNLHKKEDRVAHFERVYKTLQNEKNPIGILGMLYYFSAHKNAVAANKNFLPQTHVGFVAGKKIFTIENEENSPQTIREILEKKFGIIHEFEKDFVQKKVPLEKILAPGEKFFYEDFLVEELFRAVHAGSLFEIFLRKHRNNRITPILRPVSFARVSDEILEKISAQQKIFEKMGAVEFVPGREFSAKNFSGKKSWINFLARTFGIKNPARALAVPIPQIVETAQKNSPENF